MTSDVPRTQTTRIGAGEYGLIPGSMGTGSYVVRGLGNEASYCSASHGAGRRISRSKAKRTFTLGGLAAQTAGVECRKDAGVIDEVPGAYKDLESVIEAQTDLGRGRRPAHHADVRQGLTRGARRPGHVEPAPDRRGWQTQYMLDLDDVLNKDQLDAFMRGLARRRYHVLLGAGASVGGKSNDGRALPGAEKLAEDIRDEFGVPGSGAPNLRRLFASAAARTGAGGRRLSDFMKERFLNTDPPDWLRNFAQIGWQQVWTLNIDDTLSRAYFRWEDVAQQRLLSISWTEVHHTARPADSELLAIHLHGKASRAHREGELVFDIAGYVQATTANHRWHRLFGDAYLGQPFLIVGASLDAEIDLQAVLEREQLPQDYPSIIVLMDIDELQAEEYRRYGLVAVEATADAFFDEVVRRLPAYLSEVTHDEAEAISEVPREAMQFLHQWRRLEVDGPSRDRRHDVFKGHEPNWADAVSNFLAARDVETELLKLADPEITDPGQLLRVASGPSFSGKTAVLFSTAKAIVERGFDVFLFDSTTAPDIKAVYWWVGRHPRTVLIVDNAADFARDIKALYDLAGDGPTVPRTLALDRSYRARHMGNVLVLTPKVEHTISSRLKNGEIRRLIDVLVANRRAGDLTGLSRDHQFDYFAKVHGHELFSSMANLERGREFATRVLDEYDAVNTDERQLLAITALAARLGYSLPNEIAPASTQMSAHKIVECLRGVLGDIIFSEGGAISLRHRFMGEVLLSDRLAKSDKFDLALRLANAVAPHVSIASIRASTIYYRIARALMGHDMLENIFEGDWELVLNWFDELEQAFDWNARFWEQRALAASEAKLFEPAYSWAREAVDRRRDSLTLNTVGVVLMRRAVHESQPERWPSESFELGEQALREARSHPQANEYPYDTFFGYALRLLKRVTSVNGDTLSFLITLWDEWYLSILARDEVTRARLHGRLEGLNAEWSRLIETRSR